MNVHGVVERIRTSVEDWSGAPEGIELFTWWWFPYTERVARVLVPDEKDRGVSISGELPSYVPFPDYVTIYPSIECTYAGARAAAGWDVGTRQAVLFFGNGSYGSRLPAYKPSPAGQIDRLAEQGTAFVEEEHARRFRASVRRLVEALEESMRDVDMSWEERERIREMRERVQDW